MNFDRTSLFQHLTSEEVDELKPHIFEKHFKKGEFLFLEGDSCDRIIIVKSGQIKTFRTSCQGKEQVLEVIGPGETCACNPGFDHWNCQSSAQALEDCEIWILPKKHFLNLIQSDSKAALTLSHIFAHKLCMISQLLQDISLEDPLKRLVKFLLDRTHNIPTQDNEAVTVDLNMTQEDIANRLGVTRVTVARAFQKLKKMDLISQKTSKVIINDRKTLQKILITQ